MLLKSYQLLHKLKIRLNTLKWRLLGLNVKNVCIFPNFFTYSPNNIYLSGNVTLYEHAKIYCYNGKVTIGKNVHLSSFCYILSDNSEVEIGDNTVIGPYTVILSYSNHYKDSNKLFRKTTIVKPN